MPRPTDAEALDLLLGGESASVEFKSSLADSRRIIETLAAMATIGGGVVLVGVRDNGTVCGAAVGEGELERLVQQVLAATDPRVYVDVGWLDLRGKRVLRLRVPEGDGPHLAFGRAFYRSGPATVAMSRGEYERRLLDRLRESSGFERREEPACPLAEIDLGAVARFTALAGDRLASVGSDADPALLLDRLHLRSGDLLTAGGALLFARDPQGPFPQAAIRAHARRGAAEDSAHIDGNLVTQIDRAVTFVLRNLRVRSSRAEVRRIDEAELPLAAVREVVANAVAHRDYRSTAPIQLRLDDQALTVWNPGHLPPPLTPASLRAPHPSIPTNPRIARALYLAGYVEEWGTGTLRVIEAMEAAHNPPATFEATPGDGIRATLPLPGAGLVGLPPRSADALAGFQTGESFRAAEYAARAGVAPRTALLDLGAAEGLGLVRRVGVGRATRWQRT